LHRLVVSLSGEVWISSLAISRTLGGKKRLVVAGFCAGHQISGLQRRLISQNIFDRLKTVT
jgi:hypothetical protein